MPKHTFSAVIFDLDGVITKTALVHSAAWKKMFDEFMKSWSARNNKPFREFSHAIRAFSRFWNIAESGFLLAIRPIRRMLRQFAGWAIAKTRFSTKCWSAMAWRFTLRRWS